MSFPGPVQQHGADLSFVLTGAFIYKDVPEPTDQSTNLDSGIATKRR